MNFNKLCENIKDLKIQGAEAVAIAGLKALKLDNSKLAIKKILSLRPTEPLLQNSIENALKFDDINKGIKNSLEHIEKSKKKISDFSFKIIKKAKIVYTHCHSSTVTFALANAYKKHKFKVYNTETRPLFQGRKTAKELTSKGIEVCMYGDSGMVEAIKKCDVVLLGADWISKKGVVNKIGSSIVGDLAKHFKKPLYILADSWKFSNKKLRIELRPSEEIWNIKLKKLKIINPAFDLVNKKYIKAIISGKGILTFKEFMKKISN